MAVAGATLRQRTIALRPTIVATVIEDGAVFLDLETKYFYHLSESAWAIAQLFENEGANVESILAQTRSWGAPADDRVIELLQTFDEFGLIEDAQAGAPLIAAPPQPWSDPRIERQAEPLQNLVTSAFDPSIPLAE